jgi:hypothetical protein
MTFVAAMLFYRTPTTRQSDVPSPIDLPSGQKLLFTTPADLASRFNDSYVNNIIRQIPAQPFGRHINQNDEGSSGWTFGIEGDYLTATADSSTKLHIFEKLPQGDTYHVFGCFGIWYPRGPAYQQDDISEGCPTGFSIDPDNLHGLMITSRSGAHTGISSQLVDFSVQMSYGGDL